jgi:hypothetical protein
LAQEVSGWTVCLKPQNVRASLAGRSQRVMGSTLVKFDPEFIPDIGTSDVYLWGEAPNFGGGVRFSTDSVILVDHLGVGNPVHRENNLAHCKANRERVERACRRAFSRRLANRVSLAAVDFA